MSTRKHLGIIAILFAVLGSLLVACGSDDASDAEAAQDDAVTETDTSGGEDAGETETADSNGATSGDTERANAGEAMDISSLGMSECLGIAHAMTGTIARGMTLDFEEDLAMLRSFAAAAPDETRAEIEIFLDAHEDSYRLLSDAGISLSDPSTITAGNNQEIVNEASALVETPEVEAALETTEEFFLDTCPMMRE